MEVGLLLKFYWLVFESKGSNGHSPKQSLILCESPTFRSCDWLKINNKRQNTLKKIYNFFII